MIASVQMMHIPDGFLNLTISAVCWVLTLIALAIGVHQAQKAFDERLVPLAGIMAAFIFAGQMLNFPVAGGTSGHLLGGTLAAVVLGPWMALLVMAAVISLQALLFQDGGLVVMGANILVMGVIPIMVGYGAYRAVARRGRGVMLATAGAAAWLSIMGAALVAALLLGLSGTTSFSIAIPAMLGVHALIGIGEALITVAALSFILRARPGLLAASAEAGGRGWIVVGLALAVSLVMLAPFASSSPDGLERVARNNDFLGAALGHSYSILPNYTIPGLGDSGLSVILAGAIGALLVAAVTYGVARIVRRGRQVESTTK